MKGKNGFYIAKIEDETTKINKMTPSQEKKKKFERFASSYTGYNNEDKVVFPYVKYDNKGRQYEDLKEKKYRNDDSENKEHGGIPSYLRREEPVMTKRNIEDLKGTRLSKEEIERRNRENYGVYSAQKIVEEPQKDDGFENRVEQERGKVYEEVLSSEEIGQRNRLEREKRSTLVVRGKPFTREPDYYEDVKSDDYDRQIESTYRDEKYPDYQAQEAIQSEKYPSQPKKQRKYKFPPASLLNEPRAKSVENHVETNMQRVTIDNTLSEFKIGGHVENYTKGPTVTQFEVKLDSGVKPERVESIFKSLQMNLASESLRIEAPIAGKTAVGIEVPNTTREIVLFGEMIRNRDYLNDGKPLNVVLGKMVDGRNKYLNILDMPHVLIAGSTGSGKTVCIHAILTSVLYKATPEEVKIILVDPKRNELMYFRDMPHLASPIITDPNLATPTLKWVVDEMERRFMLFETTFKSSIETYNASIESTQPSRKLPYILIVIDEFADLINTAGESFEIYVQRIAQKARSAGIHMIIATQRPTTDVVKGTIKANFQGRIAFRVNQQIDSMTILDHSGAEKLLGKGDMLFNSGSNDIRVQNAFITIAEIERVTDLLREEYETNYMFTADDLKKQAEIDNNVSFDPRADELFERVARYVVAFQRASMNQLQKAFGMGFNRADNIMIGLEKLGIVSPVIPGRQRDVLVQSEEELDEILRR
ncbi:MAG: DNA translocase FtsK [Bacilli bacterium]|nr:DNA translocase FtsK [Bacilli bacterium]